MVEPAVTCRGAERTEEVGVPLSHPQPWMGRAKPPRTCDALDEIHFFGDEALTVLTILTLGTKRTNSSMDPRDPNLHK